MLNFLQISLTNRCNFSCWHCPMKQWRNSEAPRWPLCNGELIPFLEQYVKPSEWVIELTGGEPTLYEGLDELLDWLSEKGYYTLVKTNGSNPIGKRKNVKVCSAFHRLEQPPKYFDEYLIVDKIQSDEKVAYCKANGIPYKVIGFNKENPDNARCGFTLISFINPAGHNFSCPADVPRQIVRDGEDVGRINHTDLTTKLCCESCKAAVDAWRFLPDEIKSRAEQL